MKRVIFGVIWFIVAWLALTIANMIIFGAVVQSTSDAHGFQQGYQAGLAFDKAHHGLLIIVRLGILALSILIAVIGTWKGVLPGTRRSAAQPTTGE